MRTILDVNAEWLVGQRTKVDEMGGYTVGLVVAYGGNKILLGTTAEGKFTATAEYADDDDSHKAVSVTGRTAREAVLFCSRKLHRLGVVSVRPAV